jgi:hypothetical protein
MDWAPWPGPYPPSGRMPGAAIVAHHHHHHHHVPRVKLPPADTDAINYIKKHGIFDQLRQTIQGKMQTNGSASLSELVLIILEVIFFFNSPTILRAAQCQFIAFLQVFFFFF